jgi:Mn-dependent DtxR family transcriptional regulator
MTSLLKIFGSKAQTRLVQYLLDHKGRIFNQAGLATYLDVSPSTIARILQPLVEEGILSYEQIGGQMKIIALNDENEKTKILIDFYERLRNL